MIHSLIRIKSITPYNNYYFAYELIGMEYRMLRVDIVKDVINLHYCNFTIPHTQIPNNDYKVIMVFSGLQDLINFFYSYGLIVSTENLLSMTDTKEFFNMLNAKKSLLTK